MNNQLKNVNHIPIIASGKGWIMVDKPCGSSSHNEPGKDIVSCVSMMMEKDRALSLSIGYSKEYTISPIHRLDSETSGIILLGFDKAVQRWFSRQFEDRTIKKNYVALIHGNLDLPIGGEALWDMPLSPEAGGRKNPGGAGRKVDCRTRIRLIDHSPHYSLIECEPLTGRKHQIRRHAKLSGHPVLGDSRYGSQRAVQYMKTHCAFDRLGLHALSLCLVLPGEQESRIFSSKYPSDFQRIMDEDKRI
jgi:23S rRNA-/tRNA-specific pseudouridylate synthase